MSNIRRFGLVKDFTQRHPHTHLSQSRQTPLDFKGFTRHGGWSQNTEQNLHFIGIYHECSADLTE